MTIDPGEVAERVARLEARIETLATRPVRIVAVTKRFGLDAVDAALAAGVQDIGENYAQELAAKVEGIRERGTEQPRWHFIGHVQRNKVRLVAESVRLWQTVDTARLGREIAKRAPGAAVLVQVNLTGSPSQGGAASDDVPGLVTELRGLELDVQGLMVIGALDDLEATATLFARLRRLADDLELPECSMGMSGDIDQALVAGSTMVRVGTALFGPRPD